ncbi:hypothetical protein O181_108783 [Austropuccinia psidii MF-1]|uniref:Uncharacterized protein n=1 Tax=Austropuccinia psidii MF-1 TaxID=1389203 RepID=A0A9Q3JUU8_9BASI|nr:hypothetical protein [Austropuccinia psidii MF-1]
MKPQPHGHVMNNPYYQDDIKPDAMLMNKARSPSQYQDGDHISYSEKEDLKQLPEASSWPKFSGTGEYVHMDLIYYIDGLFIYVLWELLLCGIDEAVPGRVNYKKTVLNCCSSL